VLETYERELVTVAIIEVLLTVTCFVFVVVTAADEYEVTWLMVSCVADAPEPLMIESEIVVLVGVDVEEEDGTELGVPNIDSAAAVMEVLAEWHSWASGGCIGMTG
jgi:hypothetical protein